MKLFWIFGGLAGFFLAYLIMVFHKTKVPYMATRKVVLPKVLKLLPKNKQLLIYDLGSGMGNFLLAAEAAGYQRLIGYEYSRLLWLIAKLRLFFEKSSIQINCGDFYRIDLGRADIVYFFLTPRIRDKISEKFINNLKSGCMVISLGVDLPKLRLLKEVLVDDNKPMGSKIYVYIFK